MARIFHRDARGRFASGGAGSARGLRGSVRKLSSSKFAASTAARKRGLMAKSAAAQSFGNTPKSRKLRGRANKFGYGSGSRSSASYNIARPVRQRVKARGAPLKARAARVAKVVHGSKTLMNQMAERHINRAKRTNFNNYLNNRDAIISKADTKAEQKLYTGRGQRGQIAKRAQMSRRRGKLRG
jgi:hypothetical protein